MKFPKVLSEREKLLAEVKSLQVRVNWLNYQPVHDRFDKVDHIIDLHGHIIGMGLSPDHRYILI